MRGISWEKFESESNKLAALIDTPIDVVVGIVRGGVVPARLLASRLGVSDMYCVSVRKAGGERLLATEILDDLSGKNALLVEDMLESGKSLELVKIYLERLGADVKTAALYTMPDAKFTPDFSLKTVKSPPNFPWE